MNIQEYPDALIELAKSLVGKTGKFNGNRWRAHTDDERHKILNSHPNCKSTILSEHVYWIINDIIEYETRYCKQCGKLLPNNFIGLKNGYRVSKFCSVKCAKNSDEVSEKYKQTMLTKYGVENISQLAEIKETKKQTTLERYGVEYPAQSAIVQEKAKQTTLERYGVEYH